MKNEIKFDSTFIHVLILHVHFQSDFSVLNVLLIVYIENLTILPQIEGTESFHFCFQIFAIVLKYLLGTLKYFFNKIYHLCAIHN